MNQERNYGIDLLRVLATYMVLVLHVMGQGGIVWTIDGSSNNYIVAWLLELLAFCAVNCYALISGYVGLYKKFKLVNILMLWIQVAFISVASVAIFWCLGAEVTLGDWIKACTPVTSGTYWYFTAYFCLYFFTPFLNRFIQNENKRNLKCLVFALFFLFSLLPTIVKRDLFLLNNGYSALWLIVLYVVGGIFRKYSSEIKIKKHFLLGGYFGAVLLTLGSKLLIEFLVERFSFRLYDAFVLIRYNSPTIIIASICLLLLFANSNTNQIKRLIVCIAPVSFGVYIIHSEPFIWNHILSGRFADFKGLPTLLFVGVVLTVAFGIFLVCSALEIIRIRLFKILHISFLCKWIEELIDKWLNKSIKKLNKDGEHSE